MDKRKLPKTEEHKLKISLSQKGKKRLFTTGDKNGFWKGEKSKYSAHHMWVSLHKGKPLKCEYCLREDLKPRQYQWANIDHKYSRNLDDYIRLCASCHQKFDIKNNNYCGGKRKKYMPRTKKDVIVENKEEVNRIVIDQDHIEIEYNDGSKEIRAI